MAKPPWNARRPGLCEACGQPIAAGTLVVWGQAKGAIIHAEGCPLVNQPLSTPQTATAAAPTQGRVGDAVDAYELHELALVALSALCQNAGCADWAEAAVANRAYTLAEAFLAERNRRQGQR